MECPGCVDLVVFVSVNENACSHAAMRRAPADRAASGGSTQRTHGLSAKGSESRMHLLDLPTPVLGEIVRLLADHRAVYLVPLCLTCRAGAALVERVARLAVERRGDAVKSARSPNAEGGSQWVRFLHELQLLADPRFTMATSTVDIRFPSQYSFPQGSPGSQAVNVSGASGWAVCSAVPMTTGTHYVEFTVAELPMSSCCQLGVVSADQIDRCGESDGPHNKVIHSSSSHFKSWMYDSEGGDLFVNDGGARGCIHESWAGQEEFSTGDRVGLLLDIRSESRDLDTVQQAATSSSGTTLAVYQDDERLGVMVQSGRGLEPPLYWCARFMVGPSRLWVQGKPAPKVTASDLLEDDRKREAARERRQRHALGEFSDDESDDHV